MKLEPKYLNSSKLFTIRRSGVTSGASRNTSIFRNRFPIQFTHKKLLLKHKWFSGRNSTGKIVVFSKGSRTVKNKIPFVNYSFRDKSISIIAGFFMTPFRNKINSLVFSSSGSVSYVPTPQTHEILRFTRFNSFFKKTNRLYKFIVLLRPQSFINTILRFALIDDSSFDVLRYISIRLFNLKTDQSQSPCKCYKLSWVFGEINGWVINQFRFRFMWLLICIETLWVICKCKYFTCLCLLVIHQSIWCTLLICARQGLP